MTKNNKLISILILIGALSVALSLFIASKTESQKPGSRPLARIELNLGKVSVLRKNMTLREDLTRKATLFAQDSVESSGDGDATMEFDSGDRIRVEENSLITLDEENTRIVVIVKRGDVQVENFGRDGSVYISREGVRWTTNDYELNYKKQAPDATLPDAPSMESSAPTAKLSEGLTSEFIQDTLRTHRASFFKCYTQLLQKTPGLSGQASVNFTIENSGKVSQADVSYSSLSDTGFKACLIEATRRVEFRAFKGPAITTVFPLKFE